MAQRGERSPVVPLGDMSDPQGLSVLGESFLEGMAARSFSLSTVKNHRCNLRAFIAWCAERDIKRPHDVTSATLERYRRHIFRAKSKRTERALGSSSQLQRLIAVKNFFRDLVKRGHILFNPAADLEMPKMPKHLPRHVLSVEETERVLMQPNVVSPIGLRDRTMLETLYSTGMRRMELASLLLEDLDFSRGTLLVREGKGRKDRHIPIGARALAWIEKYLDEARPGFVVEPDAGVVFLTRDGTPLSFSYVTMMVKRYVVAAGLDKGACHLFRHTAATLMLENGADVRFIQALLGHEHLTSTQIYTRVAITKLKEVHTATHPAKLERPIIDDDER